MRAAIITASTSGYHQLREDKSGPVIREMLEEAGYEVVFTTVLPDNRKILSVTMQRLADDEIAELVLTTGGTGFSQTDVTPEATLDIVERQVPGIPEAMRNLSMQYTKRAMLSRQAAGIRKKTLVINLPGSPKAVKECLEFILPELKHGLEILTGDASDCARK